MTQKGEGKRKRERERDLHTAKTGRRSSCFYCGAAIEEWCNRKVIRLLRRRSKNDYCGTPLLRRPGRSRRESATIRALLYGPLFW